MKTRKKKIPKATVKGKKKNDSGSKRSVERRRKKTGRRDNRAGKRGKTKGGARHLITHPEKCGPTGRRKTGAEERGAHGWGGRVGSGEAVGNGQVGLT